MKFLFVTILYLSSISLTFSDEYPVLPSIDHDITASSLIAETQPDDDLPDTNGYYFENENGDAIIVNDEDEPDCVFYLSYVEGNDIQVTQYNDIDQITLNCE